MTDSQIYAGAAAMGAMAGVRSMSAPAMVSQVAKAGRLAIGESEASFLQSPTLGVALTALAIGELIADKLPFMPDRTKAPSLTARAVTGAVSGAMICAARKKSPWIGAAVGAASAVAAAYAFFHLRRLSVEKLHFPKPVAGVVEDALLAGAGMLLSSQFRSEPA